MVIRKYTQLKKFLKLVNLYHFMLQQKNQMRYYHILIVKYIIYLLLVLDFTVYGPMGRPDMAPYKFTKAAIENKTIQIYNKGIHERDFTYVTDVAKVIFQLSNKMNKSIFQILNVCSSKTIKLMDFIKLIERLTNKQLIKNLLKDKKVM